MGFHNITTKSRENKTSSESSKLAIKHFEIFFIVFVTQIDKATN